MDYLKWLEIPQDLRASMREYYTVSNAVNGRLLLRGYAESIEVVSAHKIVLRRTIIDSSDRHEGILLQERWSFHEEFTFGGGIVWCSRPVPKEDPKAEKI